MRRSRSTYLAGIVLLVLVVACDSELTLSPPSPGALVPEGGQDIATLHPSHVGATNPGFGTGSCPSPGWGWHFVMQGSPSENYFVELAATFSRDGDQVTLRAEEFEPNEQHGYIYTDGPGWRLDGAEAIVVGGRDRFNLSHVCSGPDETTTTGESTTSLPVTTTTVLTTTSTIEATTTLEIGGVTTTTTGEVTTTTSGAATTTTVAETATTIEGATTTTGAGGATTTTGSDVSTTSDGGTAGAGQTTAPEGDDGASTSTGDVAGSDVLPETGGGTASNAGLAGLLLLAGLVLVSVARRTSSRQDR